MAQLTDEHILLIVRIDERVGTIVKKLDHQDELNERLDGEIKDVDEKIDTVNLKVNWILGVGAGIGFIGGVAKLVGVI